jgi:hypothetical protein
MIRKDERTVELDAPADRLEPRLMDWAQASDFVCTECKPGRWTFRRGDGGMALFTRDILMMPTRAVVQVIGQPPLTIRASMYVDTGGRLTRAARDAREIDEQMRRMLAYLRGVYDF